MSDEDVEFERSLDRDEIAALFREFASGFEAGLPIAIDGIDGDHPVEFDPPRDASVELELETDGERDDGGDSSTIELEIELAWTTGGETAGSADGPDEADGDAIDEQGALRRVTDLDAIDENAIPVAATPSPESGRRSRFEVYRDRADEYRWRLVHWNGNVIADSGEGYASRANAVNGLRSVVENAPDARIEHVDRSA